MSGFMHTLYAMDRRELVECARGLLACLAGAEATADSVGGERGEPAARAGGGHSGFGFGEAGGERRGGLSPGAAGTQAGAERRGGAAEAERAGRGLIHTEQAGRGGLEGAALDGAGEGPCAARGPEPAVRGSADGAGGGQESTAAFQGPERRYENAVGARGMEMSRVSEFFKRDSRRYGQLK